MNRFCLIKIKMKKIQNQYSKFTTDKRCEVENSFIVKKINVIAYCVSTHVIYMDTLFYGF